MFFSFSKMHVCILLLSALTVVEVKSIDIRGHVGQTVTVKCSAWNISHAVNVNSKYLCQKPCWQSTDIIAKALSGETKRQDRIEISNKGDSLIVKFTNLKMSDSKSYECGVDRIGVDAHIEVHLTVTEAAGHKLPVEPATVGFTVSTAAAPVTQVPSFSPSLLYVIIGLTVTTNVVTLMVLWKCKRRANRQKNVESSPNAPQQDECALAQYEPEFFVDEPAVVYENLHPSTSDGDYNTLHPAKWM
ncbi:uncharacterized protein LOC114441069 [Parambassis ranga]|uniref:Uncharacterized protein LOC114441069 n=1 Tax=Parambassis ranga TaxID=210632 RepID=A0A6P7IZ59_9TELE|nr:uncharacterized protein LOC114441069 [Parambassis ranga]